MKPVYEIVKVTKHKVFIIGLGNPCISDNLEFVSRQFPDKHIFFVDELGDSLEWWKLIRGSPQHRWVDEMFFGATQYNGKIPNIKPWDKILNFKL